MIPVDHQRVAVQRGRAALAVRVARLHVAEVDLPDGPALQVQRIDPAGTERCVQAFAVGDRGIRGPASRHVSRLVRLFRAHGPAPSRRTVSRIVGQDDELHAVLGRRVVVSPVVLVGVIRLERRAVRDRRGEEDAVTPYDRR